jgi:hypothetical protein
MARREMIPSDRCRRAEEVPLYEALLDVGGPLRSIVDPASWILPEEYLGVLASRPEPVHPESLAVVE